MLSSAYLSDRAQSGRNVTSDAIRSTWDIPLDFPKFEGIETEENAPALSVQELCKENPGKDLKAGSTLKDTAVKLEEVDNNIEVDKTKIHTSIVKDSGQTVEENGEKIAT